MPRPTSPKPRRASDTSAGIDPHFSPGRSRGRRVLDGLRRAPDVRQYVIGELGGSVRDGLGLDTLEVGLPEGEEGTGHVTVGRYVTRDVLVSVGHEFGSTVAEVFGVEYGITRSISVRGSTSTEGRSAVDLFWRRRY